MIHKFLKNKSYLYKVVSKIIVLYSNKGDYDKKFDISLLKKRVLPKVIESIIIALLFVFISNIMESSIRSDKIISFSISFFASILGFGMAAYTILLMLADEILYFLDDRKKHTPQILNADLAFPLIMIGFVVFLMFMLFSFGNSSFSLFLSSALFIYGLLLIFEIISVIYLSMGLVIKRKIEKRDKSKEI